ncbi:hypothetical protein BROOK1789C_1879, partial [Bathymodiolus brooksi thiotrophic gill symbiont]
GCRGRDRILIGFTSRYVIKTKTKNLYSQINHTLQWYREVTYKNTTQHIHDK